MMPEMDDQPKVLTGILGGCHTGLFIYLPISLLGGTGKLGWFDATKEKDVSAAAWGAPST